MVFWCEPLPRNIYWSMVSQSPRARYSFPSSQTRYLSLTLSFPRFAGWSLRNFGGVHNNASQVPRSKVSSLPSIDICGVGLVRPRTLDPWALCVPHVADDEQSFSLYSGKSRLPSNWDFVLCSKSPSYVHKRKLTTTHVVIRPSFPNVDMLADLTDGAPIQSSTFW